MHHDFARFNRETEFGTTRVVELMPGGSEIDVTEDNVEKYVELYCAHKLGVLKTQAEIEAFKEGFHGVIPLKNIRMFDDREYA